MGWWNGLQDQAEWERDQARYEKDPQLYVLGAINQNLHSIRTAITWLMILIAPAVGKIVFGGPLIDLWGK